MDRKLTITWDFDGSMAEEYQQEVAKKLIDEGHDVWILTTRRDELHKHLYNASEEHLEHIHDYLYEVADKLGLRNKILFTNFTWKGYYLKDTKVDIHIDDNTVDEPGPIKKQAPHVYFFPVKPYGEGVEEFEERLRDVMEQLMVQRASLK